MIAMAIPTITHIAIMAIIANVIARSLHVVERSINSIHSTSFSRGKTTNPTFICVRGVG
jgi:hypothetical protein